MENKNQNKEREFDTFLNKTIIMTSKQYFRDEMKFNRKEKTIFDNEDYSAFLQSICEHNVPFTTIADVETKLHLNSALNCLSDIEQAVIFLLFKNELTEDEASKILEIWSKSVSRIKLRAINKLKNYFEGEMNDEK